MVGLFANTAHVIDVGGLGMGPEGRSVFEEGMYIPIVKCFDRGVPNETFFDILRAGTRLPVKLEGDVYSLCACNDAGIRRLDEMMTEFGLDGLDDLAGHIFDASRRATIAAIAALPPGVYRSEIGSDGYEAPVQLQATMTVADDNITVDFTGTSGPVHPGHQRARRLHPRLHGIRHQGGCRARHPEQHRLARAVPLHDPGGLHPERGLAPTRCRCAT